MTTIKSDVNPGVCGLSTTIEAISEDGMNVTVKVSSECGAVNQLAGVLPEQINAFSELFKPLCEINVIESAAEQLPHRTCIVPAAILKSVEAAAGMALPKDVEITFVKVE
jgi:hypothetical protein